ncbi:MULTISPECIES: hypothetical protein [Sinorhizobium]|uniref:hypothetical protein n=1 Tax=Sinorhizobium TaxID=28105 RepID=UPI00067FC564|nr:MULTISPECIES: hypothetical protein [Sinorhizobium]
MPDETERTRKIIDAPRAHPRRAGIRAIVEALAGFGPITGALARLYHTTHPPKSEQEREDWQKSITERSNEHDMRLDRHEEILSPSEIKFSGLEAQMIHAVGHACPDGLAEHFLHLDELKDLLPETSEDEIIDKAEELAGYGLLSLQNTIGAWRVRPTQLFYEQFDHQLMRWEGGGTRQDAMRIAQLMLENIELQSPELHELTGWPLRRFNPALSLLKNEHPDWNWRDRYHFDFPSLGLVVGGRERAGLRRFVRAI